jgi:rhodanese-related sulfurtransferase
MKTKRQFNYSILIIALALITFFGCKRTEIDSSAAAYSTLTTHLKSVHLDINKVIKNADGKKFVMAAPADGNLSAKWVMDIRSAQNFSTAHITGAHNVEFKNILTAAATADKPILVVCYTGQTACYATALLRLYGYSDTQALKWGMSGWNTTFDKWTPNCKDLTTATNWTTDVTLPGTFNSPTITTSTTDGAALLKERVEVVVAAGFKAVGASTVLADPSKYYINNFFSDAHYKGFGHINGAVRVSPLLIDDCSKLDPSKQIVTYCYTGQTSAIITAYLNVLGFDAISLKFGINSMSKSNPFWTAGSGIKNHWGFDSNPKSLPTVSN